MHSARKKRWKNEANLPRPVSSSPGADWVRFAELQYSACEVPAGQAVARPRERRFWRSHDCVKRSQSGGRNGPPMTPRFQNSAVPSDSFGQRGHHRRLCFGDRGFQPHDGWGSGPLGSFQPLPGRLVVPAEPKDVLRYRLLNTMSKFTQRTEQVVSPDELDDLLEVVGGFDRGVAELALTVFVVTDRDVRVLERVTRQDAGDAGVLRDHSL